MEIKVGKSLSQVEIFVEGICKLKNGKRPPLWRGWSVSSGPEETEYDESCEHYVFRYAQEYSIAEIVHQIFSLLRGMMTILSIVNVIMVINRLLTCGRDVTREAISQMVNNMTALTPSIMASKH